MSAVTAGYSCLRNSWKQNLGHSARTISHFRFSPNVSLLPSRFFRTTGDMAARGSPAWCLPLSAPEWDRYLLCLVPNFKAAEISLTQAGIITALFPLLSTLSGPWEGLSPCVRQTVDVREMEGALGKITPEFGDQWGGDTINSIRLPESNSHGRAQGIASQWRMWTVNVRVNRLDWNSSSTTDICVTVGKLFQPSKPPLLHP